MRRGGRKSFGFAINYGRAIADDETEIAGLSDPQAIAVSAAMSEMDWERERKGYRWDPVSFVWHAPDQATRRLAVGYCR